MERGGAEMPSGGRRKLLKKVLTYYQTFDILELASNQQHMTLTIVFKDEKMTEMMKKADVFESFKCIAEVVEVAVEKLPTKKQLIKIFKEESVVLVSNGKHTLYDEQYRVYSDGKRWFMRDDFIKILTK